MDGFVFPAPVGFQSAQTRLGFRLTTSRHFLNPPVKKLCFFLAASVLTATARAQDAATPPDLVGNRNRSEVERVIVTGTSIDDANDVLPTPSVNNSAYGNGRDILDTPRSVDTLTPTVLEDDQIRDLRDILRATSDTYSPNVFGLTSLPYIRGQEGEVFYNGIRRGGGNNGYGLPFSFNPVESIDVVKGPATPVYGATQRVGGYVNLVTKQPYFDTWHTELTGTYGSYDFKRYQIDSGGPLIKDKLAFRVSFEQEDDGSYYRNAYYQSIDVYAALAWKPYDGLRIDANFEYLDVPHYPDIAGINRPTQALIDNDTYIQGTGISPITGTVPGPGAVVSPTGTTTISHSQVFVDPADYSNSHSYIGQIAGTLKVNNAFSVVNRSFFQSLDKETVNQNSFRELIPTNYTFENRTEFNLNFDVPIGSESIGGTTSPLRDKDGKEVTSSAQTVPFLDIRNSIIAGFDFRYLHAVGYSQFLTEADEPNDLTKSLLLTRVPVSTVMSLVNVFHAPSYPSNFYVSSGGTYNNYVNPVTGLTGTPNSDSNATDIYQGGLFWQQNIAFTPWINIDFGGRGDLLATTVTDPVPPPGFTAASDSIVVGEGAANASLTIKPTSFISIYGTFNFSQSSNSALGGGYTLDGNNELESQNFHIASYLYEAGIKASLLKNQLYLSVAGFDQTRSLRNRDGSVSALDFNGVEFEAVYQPNKNFHASMSLSYIQGHTTDSTLSQDTGSVNDTFDNSAPNIIHGTGVGSPSYTVFGPGDLRYPGLPSILFNSTISYTSNFGLGALINATVTNDQNLDVPGTVKIPAQYELDAAVFYKRKNLEVRLDVLNFTDQHNWSPAFEGGFFGSTDVFPELPIRVQGTVAVKF